MSKGNPEETICNDAAQIKEGQRKFQQQNRAGHKKQGLKKSLNGVMGGTLAHQGEFLGGSYLCLFLKCGMAMARGYSRDRGW